jgi:hypothetical protein
MFIDFLIEEESAESALQHLIPAILGTDVAYRAIRFQGKPDLLKKLPDRLKGYSNWIPDDYRIVVLVDEDRQDCRMLKQELETVATRAGLITKSTAREGSVFQVLNRIAVEELEAWFFGDVDALRTAYPRVSPNLHKNHRYRDPDAISGGTWEALERVLQQNGYFQGGLPKIQAADEIAQHMVPERNTSRSFQIFHAGLLAIQA